MKKHISTSRFNSVVLTFCITFVTVNVSYAALTPQEVAELFPILFGAALDPDPNGDYDGDGLTNDEEGMLGTNYANADTDGDGLSDKWENTHGLDPIATDESGDDPDFDGLTNLEEQAFGGAPFIYDVDSDRDGVADIAEFTACIGVVGGDSDGDGA
ncbi:MAG: hypothetical protein V3T17_09025 [Pseudomonadales bacterium]